MYIINLILVFRLLLVYSLFHRLPPSSLHLRGGKRRGPMKQECPVSLPRSSRTSSMSPSSNDLPSRFNPVCLSLSLSLSRFHPRSSSFRHSRSFAPFARLLSFSKRTIPVLLPRPTFTDFPSQLSCLLVASVHKRVINYLRVGHVFPPCSPTLTSLSLYPHHRSSSHVLPLSPSLPDTVSRSSRCLALGHAVPEHILFAHTLLC